ncbi:UTP--glucose-1-phosphate uridylyltransferase GalU [Egicoccus halophilus]|uniref:UTP--glucose-1-phosphate uridylyltransferase n=1 Tax=Egicoccus halophilus TaxID=1670830 RepID=A0A8J3A5M1_9ACTN|nr:UTP--glucose-1-phosphate uridylyltransferase GalU [Egicoccus halophilus]GGI03641.1 UTP--glucose-1-phosphate uridylyltransferase [Egicoccus halophilus]
MVRKAVLPVAGLGTRFLPATKAVPKEMMPLVDRPAIQYVVEECVRAGLDDVLLVTSTGKSAIPDHFDRRLDLEQALEAKGKDEELAVVRQLAELAQMHSIRQGEQLGLGHAVLMAAGHVEADESFAVLLGDDIVDPAVPFLERMVEAHERTGRPVVALMEVPHDQVHLYGVADVEAGERDGEFTIRRLVEKPDPADAPSNLIVVGRYVLPGSIFDVLRDTPPGSGGEIQLTDALETMAAEEPIVGIRLDDERYDTGDKLGFLKATVQLAAKRDDLGDEFVAWLRDWLAEQDA